MPAEPIWTRRAEADLLLHYSQLEDFRSGAGERLMSLIDSSVRLLRLMPEMAPIYSGHYRRMVLRNPRYGLFYTVEDRGMIVHALCDLTQSREMILRHLEIKKP